MSKNIWKLSTLAFATAFGLSLAMPAAQADRQPLMRDALGHLNSARNVLTRATNDKGGHRVKAIAAVDEAIAQTKKGIAFDNHH